MRGFFCALFAGILCLESIGGFCRQGYVSEGIREQATHLFHETAEKEAGQLQEDLHLYAQAAVLLDADSGRVLYGKNEETPMAMASTTKIMTCILVLENAKVEEEVSISAYAATMPKVKLYVKKGEHYTVRELLFSLMLESHNDSAVAIAEHIGGSVEQFAELMNQKAVDIGCMKTHFITPNGLDAKDKHGIHGTTAADLARILRYCIKESPEKDTFLTITRTSVYSFTNLAGTRSFTCNNHNAFLNMMDGALTGKTGFTGTAGYCYVGALERDGKLFIVALLGCGWPGNKTYKWADTKKLMNYGLDHYQEHTIKDDILQKTDIPIQYDPNYRRQQDAEKATIAWDCSFSETLLLREDEQITVRYILPEKLGLPLQTGMQIGSVVLSINGKVYAIYPVFITETISEMTWKDFISGYIKYYIDRNYS